jgi:hypothetical protein
MYRKLLFEIYVLFLLCALMTDNSITEAVAREGSSKGRHISIAEKSLLRSLGLAEDANDIEIIRLLDVPDKRISAAALVRYKKIYSATPKLLQIVKDDKIFFPAKIVAAKALCDFGNKEWMQPVKLLITDPNSIIAHSPYEIEVAGLLARAGDYSHFEIVKKGINDTKSWVRHVSVKALANFRHKTDPVTGSALELLTSVAMSDPMPRLRKEAIRSLEKIAEIRPDAKQRVISALEANVDSPDKNLSIICKAKLKHYREQPKNTQK